MPECSCGNEIKAKNSAGHWRDACANCMSETAQNRTPHLVRCTEDSCGVCHSKLQEIKSVMEPIYLRTLLERPQRTENETLDTYK